jgi:hypothetical protein
VQRIEGRRSFHHLVAPADQDIGVIAGGDLMAFPDLVGRLREGQG